MEVMRNAWMDSNDEQRASVSMPKFSCVLSRQSRSFPSANSFRLPLGAATSRAY
jgi:hypothetical protein